MKIVKFFSSIHCILFMILVLNLSCEDDLEELQTITYAQCENDNVVTDLSIVTDFECQSNQTLPNVEAIRNPNEIGINKSKFVGKYTDGTGPQDALVIDFGEPIDLSTHALFKIKIKTDISAEAKVRLEGGTSVPVEITVSLDGNNKWIEYQFDFSDQKDQNHTKIVIFFNQGIENDGTKEIYFLDDLFFDVSVIIPDPCENTQKDSSILNDFDCQQNVFLGDPTMDTTAPVIANPSKSGINTSQFVGEYKDNGTEPFDNLFIDLESPIDLSTNSQLSIKILTKKTGPLTVKLDGGTPIEITKTISTIDQWVEYTFDFRTAVGAGNTNVLLFFNAGMTDGTAEDIYYIDDIRFKEFVDPCAGIIADLSIVSDFECQQNFQLGDSPGFVPVVENPNKSGVNTSESVGEYTDDGTNAWDNLAIDFGGAIDLSVNSQLNIKIHSSKTVPLLAKLEGGTAVEIWGNIDVAGEWKNYTFDFSAAAGNGNTKVVLFFNGGQSDGTATDIYYIDDIKFTSKDCSIIVEDCAGVTPDLSIISDFDCQQNFQLGDSPGFVPVVANPNVSCSNRSSNVGEYTDDGTNAWDNLAIDFGGVIDLSVNSKLSIKIHSSKTVPLLAKLEGGTAVEIWGNIDVAGEWKNYTFDFSAAAGNGNTKVVLFFNGGQSDGTATDTYHIDDLKFVTP
ncbi:hypothetical protein [Aquimarina sp. AU58]|uniref:hypothetical protein n=1 Tax=Aquimarina sp. AU58 TaxID=1874112 RepID=UPI00135A3460|nr:hypothetical protein [Aquimarina sp. AU58]